MEQNHNVTTQLENLTSLSTNENATVAWAAQQALIVAESRKNGDISAEEGADILADLRQQANIAIAADDVENKVLVDSLLSTTSAILTFMV
jgi:polyhydroxyalkanoate synthesis regulator phasin